MDENKAVYGMYNGVFMKLADDWSAVADDERQAMFELTNYEIPSTKQLAAIGNFKAMLYRKFSDKPKLTLRATPKPQFVLLRKLIGMETFEGIEKAEITANILANPNCKILVTTDLENYQTYDFENQVWQPIEHTNLVEIANLGIDAAGIQKIPRAAWNALINGKAGFAFIYMLSAEGAADICDIDKVRLNVDMKGAWEKVLF